ncbi:NAD(P)-dependent oxidoreductase [Kibdelosporangium phytohabitans]|nr:NAD(P)-dependent oxidoreductase [Kibdelosporangium phytohabitans]MBE1470730.1 3-hydroxyisobutyrate dehydrogenase [Kibdelosporangium phytohabitans]
MKIAFLGLGTMGLPMATRLVAAGHDVTTWNRSPGRTVSGAASATSPRAAAEGAEVVITMLSGPPAVEEVVLMAGLESTTVLVEMSTIGPDAVTELAGKVAGRLVAAPVGGSVGQARAGKLVVFAGGDLAGVDTVLGVFGTVVPFPDARSAAAAKLVVNTALVGGLALLGELRELAARLDVSADALLAAGPMGQFVTRATGADAHFTTALATKDLTLLGDRAGPLTITALARLATIPPDAELGVLADPRGRP